MPRPGSMRVRGRCCAEVPGQVPLDGGAVRRRRRAAFRERGREAAAEVQQPEPDPRLAQHPEDPARSRRSARPTPRGRAAASRRGTTLRPGRDPGWAACRSTSMACWVEHPNLRDSGQSEPSPEVTSRQSTDEPGAASASLAISSRLSTTNRRTPRAAAYAMSARRLIGLEYTRSAAGTRRERGEHLGRTGHVEPAAGRVAAPRAAAARGSPSPRSGWPCPAGPGPAGGTARRPRPRAGVRYGVAGRRVSGGYDRRRAGSSTGTEGDMRSPGRGSRISTGPATGGGGSSGLRYVVRSRWGRTDAAAVLGAATWEASGCRRRPGSSRRSGTCCGRTRAPSTPARRARRGASGTARSRRAWP